MTQPTSRRFREPSLWNFCRRLRAICFDVGHPNDLAPLLGFGGDELSELGRRTRNCRAAQVGKPRSQLGIGKARVDFLGELLDDVASGLPTAAWPAPRIWLGCARRAARIRDEICGHAPGTAMSMSIPPSTIWRRR